MSRWKDQIAAEGLGRASVCYARDPELYETLAPNPAQQWREKWRRITGITRSMQTFLDPRERRAHLARLADWITQRVKDSTRAQADAATRRSGGPARGPGGEAARSSDVSALIANEASGVPETPPSEIRSPLSPCGRGVGGEGDSAPSIGCTTEWLPELPQWSSVANASLSVESLCEELGIARQMLTRLLREYCGLSSGEFVDGLRLRGLKNTLLTQLKVAARVLWGAPGYQAELMAGGEHPTHTWKLPQKNSRFFQPQPEDWRELNEWRCDINARVAALLQKLSQLRGPGNEDEIMRWGVDPEKFDMQMLAMGLGFRDRRKINEACVRVFGKSLEKIERILAQEIVRYYIAAEDRTLREIALKAGESAYIARARYLYHGDDERAPGEPFLDQWSAAEAFQKDWLEAMTQEFG